MPSQLTFNGINGADGGYLLPPLAPHDLAGLVLGEKRERVHLAELEKRIETVHVLGPKEGVDPKDLAQTGWGIVFAAQDADRTPALLDALAPLIALRKEQAGGRFRIYQGADGVQVGESKNQFFSRHGVAPGPADPDKMPYYLLFVGDPETIPFHFQYQADVQYAIGRLHFAGLEDYVHYARSVALAESGQASVAQRAAFFGPHNPDDPATALSAEQLVAPLAQQIDQDQPGWQVESYTGQAASKAQLSRLLGGDLTPALLFSASHGMAFPTGHPRQLPDQGALLCQDWPGPLHWNKAIPKDFYLAADDISDDAGLLGMIPFFFACYGAGTPRLDDFAHLALDKPVAIAPYAFLSRLPQRLLSHPRGGALAVVGHVDRAWGYSFMWDNAGAQLEVFRSTLKRLLEGHPIGSAIEFFNERYAQLAADLTSELERVKFGAQPDDEALAGLWTAHNDARSYLVLGDPAVRLPRIGAAAAAPPPLPAIELRPDPLSALEPPRLLVLDLNAPDLVGLWRLAEPTPWDTIAFQNELRAAAGKGWWLVEEPDAGEGADAWMTAAPQRLAQVEEALAQALPRFATVVQHWRAGMGGDDKLDAAQAEALRLLRALVGPRRRRTALGEQAVADFLAGQRLLAQALADPAWVELRRAAMPLARVELSWGSAQQVAIKPAGQGLVLEAPLQQAVALVAATRELLRRVQSLAAQLAQLAGDQGRPADAMAALPVAHRFILASLAQD